MKNFFALLHQVRRAGAFSPTAFVVRAGLICFFYGLAEILGLREYTTFLSGTSANPNLSWQTAQILGGIYLLLYVAFILLAPISLLTAGILWAWEASKRRSKAKRLAAPQSPR